MRGQEAWNRIKAANESNKPPATDYEYILARIGFEMTARGAPGDKTFEPGRKMQFSALSAVGSEYEAPSVVLPKPELTRRVSADKPAEGWLAFSVKQEDSKPVMFFDPASGGAMGRGKMLFFQLY